MDPLSAIGSASTLVFATIKAVKGLHDLRERYRSATTMITSLTSECNILHAALSQIQRLALADSYFERLTSQPDLADSLELVLLSCMQTFSALEEEIQKVSQGSDGKNDRFLRLKYLWNEDTMKEIAQQLRCQQNSINFILTAVQTESISDIHSQLLRANVLLERLAARSDELWANQRNLNNDSSSILSFSTFEGELRSSGVYRRVSMANRRAKETGKVPETFANGDLIDLSDDTTDDAQKNEPYLSELKRNMVTLSLLTIGGIGSQGIQEPLQQAENSSQDIPAESSQSEDAGSTSTLNEEELRSERINNCLLLEYSRVTEKDRLPSVRLPSSSEKLPFGWSLRCSPTGKPYYSDDIEGYLFYSPPIRMDEDDIERELPPGWVRFESKFGRVRWVHSATGFVSHKHPYNNSRLFMYDFLRDWPFGKNGERRRTLKVYPRAFDFVGDNDGSCQLTQKAFEA